MLGCYQQLAARPSYQDSLKILEADIQHANMLARSIPRGKGGIYLQMKLVHSDGRLNVSSYGRKATTSEFYDVILPSLKRLHCDSSDFEMTQERSREMEVAVRKIYDADLEREDECGICLEPCTKMVLPNCCHAMCINCYHEWNTRSESCPFCRG